MSFVKVIYFDESFVTDFMQIIAGGEMKQTTEFVSELSANVHSEGNVEVGVDSNTKGLAKLVSLISGTNLSLNAGAGIGTVYAKDKVVKNILENTLLADFLKLLKDDDKRPKNKRCESIKIFKNLKVRPEPNSFTFLMLAAPFFSIIDGEMPIEGFNDSKFNIDITKIEKAIQEGRGYYEFIANDGDKEIILRFNISAFRNNYTMSDLTKMQLNYYGVLVGKTDKERLQMQEEFMFGTNESTRVSYENHSSNNQSEIEVYDIVLAGIEE